MKITDHANYNMVLGLITCFSALCVFFIICMTIRNLYHMLKYGEPFESPFRTILRDLKHKRIAICAFVMSTAIAIGHLCAPYVIGSTRINAIYQRPHYSEYYFARIVDDDGWFCPCIVLLHKDQDGYKYRYAIDQIKLTKIGEYMPIDTYISFDMSSPIQYSEYYASDSFYMNYLDKARSSDISSNYRIVLIDIANAGSVDNLRNEIPRS